MEWELLSQPEISTQPLDAGAPGIQPVKPLSPEPPHNQLLDAELTCIHRMSNDIRIGDGMSS